jgi:hypothetical protein
MSMNVIQKDSQVESLLLELPKYLWSLMTPNMNEDIGEWAR